MNELGEQLYELICERYGSVPRLAEKLNMPSQTIYSMYRNGVTGSSLDTVMPVAVALDIDPVALNNGEIVARHTEDKNYVDTPLVDFQALSKIAAVSPHTAQNAESEEKVRTGSFPLPHTLHEQYPKSFFVRIPDSSMDRILPEGCYALVAPCDSIERPGMPYVLAVRNHGLAAMRIRPLANGLELKPDSTDPTYQTFVVDFGKTARSDIALIGRIVWYAIPFDWDFEEK